MIILTSLQIEFILLQVKFFHKFIFLQITIIGIKKFSKKLLPQILLHVCVEWHKTGIKSGLKKLWITSISLWQIDRRNSERTLDERKVHGLNFSRKCLGSKITNNILSWIGWFNYSENKSAIKSYRTSLCDLGDEMFFSIASNVQGISRSLDLNIVC